MTRVTYYASLGCLMSLQLHANATNLDYFRLIQGNDPSPEAHLSHNTICFDLNYIDVISSTIKLRCLSLNGMRVCHGMSLLEVY